MRTFFLLLHAQIHNVQIFIHSFSVWYFNAQIDRIKVHWWFASFYVVGLFPNFNHLFLSIFLSYFVSLSIEFSLSAFFFCHYELLCKQFWENQNAIKRKDKNTKNLFKIRRKSNNTNKIESCNKIIYCAKLLKRRVDKLKLAEREKKSMPEKYCTVDHLEWFVSVLIFNSHENRLSCIVTNSTNWYGHMLSTSNL